jgi:hypothetical protein
MRHSVPKDSALDRDVGARAFMTVVRTNVVRAPTFVELRIKRRRSKKSLRTMLSSIKTCEEYDMWAPCAMAAHSDAVLVRRAGYKLVRRNVVLPVPRPASMRVGKDRTRRSLNQRENAGAAPARSAGGNRGAGQSAIRCVDEGFGGAVERAIARVNVGAEMRNTRLWPAIRRIFRGGR